MAARRRQFLNFFIINLLLIVNGATYTKDALDVMLTELEEQGYSFIQLSSLIYTSNYYLDHTGKQFLKNE